MLVKDKQHTAKCPRGNILYSVNALTVSILYRILLNTRRASRGLVQTIMSISMDLSVAREYVSQQLESMEVRHITQEEIEAYTLGK